MALYIVDGNNLKGYLLDSGLLHSADDAETVGWLRRRQGERRRRRGKGDRMIVFFDAGAADRRPTGDSTLIVRVAPNSLTADESIVREIARMPAAKGKRDATLITSDQALREQALALGVSVVDCERFAGTAAPPRPAEFEAKDKEQAARVVGRSLDAAFLPMRERRDLDTSSKPSVRLSPRKVSQLRDPLRLAALLRQGDRTIRRRAALALAMTKTEQGRQILEQVLVADPVPSVRAAAATALGRIADIRSMDALRKAAGDPYSLVRAAVAAALGEFADSRAAAILETLKQDSRRRVRQAAMRTAGDSD